MTKETCLNNYLKPLEKTGLKHLSFVACYSSFHTKLHKVLYNP